MEKLQIRAETSKGGAKLLIISSTLFLLVLLYSMLLAERFNIVLGLLLIACGLAMFAGWGKLSEPVFFLECDETGIHYHHRRGSWQLPWDGFLYCALPQLEQQTMAFIGFKVTDYDRFLQQLPLRLAVRIMTEQQPLLFAAVRQQCASGQCAGELLQATDKFQTRLQRYDGVRGIFAQRMQTLSQATGYDVFVPLSLPEEDARRLCQLINKTRLQLIQNTVT